MRHLIPVATVALLLAVTPALAQTTEDPANDTNGETTGETTENETEGNFSRDIPEGLKATLSEEEISDYQARLDAATTPQERNAIRQELQRTSRERHVESVQEQKRENLGLFGNMAADFKDIISGKAAKDAKARDKSGAGKNNASGAKSKSGGNGKSGGKSGGGGRSGGGGGGGRNK